MALWQGRSVRKPSGGRLRPFRNKKKFEMGREQELASVGKHETKAIRVAGGNQKVRVLSAGLANVLDPKTHKTQKVKILSVKDNAANQHFVTRNIVTRGATIQTEKGLARVTSRPGQDGVINAVLLEGGDAKPA